MASGGVPVVYHRAVPVVQSTTLCVPPYHGTRLRMPAGGGLDGDLREIRQACAHHRRAAPVLAVQGAAAAQTAGHRAATAPAGSPAGVDTGRRA